MRPLFTLAGLLLAALLALALAGAIAGSAGERFDPVRYAREQAEAERIARDAEIAATLQPLDLAMAAAWRVLPLGVALLAVAGAGAWGSLALIRFRRERWPRDNGLLPVEAVQLATVAPQALGAWHAARQLEAQQQPVPHTITYSPHAAYHNRVDGAGIPLAPALQPPGDLPSFRALLDAGRVGQGRPMLLGLDRTTGEPVEGSWLDLYSCAVGGLSGTGKSWTATFLLAQAALQGSRLLLLDPHADNPESLTSRLGPMRARFVCEPATTPAEMLAAVKLARGELDRRKAGGYARGSAPIVVVADEFAALQRGELADPLAELVEALGQEGRKYDLFGMICSQVWSAERAGGTPLRDSLAAAYVHRLRPAQARMMTGLTSADLPDDLFTLPQGVAYLVTTGGDLRPVVIPRMEAGDLGRVAELLGGVSTSAAASAAPSEGRPLGFRPPAPGSGAGSGIGSDTPRPTSSASGSAGSPSAEDARILALFLAGKGVAEIAEELAGQKGGRRYTEAAARVAEVLRRALAGAGRG